MAKSKPRPKGKGSNGKGKYQLGGVPAVAPRIQLRTPLSRGVNPVTANRVQQAIANLRQSGAFNVEAGTNGKGRKNPNAALVPHIITFTGYSGQLGKVYRNPDEAWRHSRENARYMRNDLAIMECLEARQRAVALLPWHLETDEPNNPVDKELIQTLTEIIKTIPRFVEMRRCLLEAIWYGRSGVQLNYGKKNLRGKLVTTLVPYGRMLPWTPINGDKVAFRYDDHRVGIRIGWVVREEEWSDSGLEFQQGTVKRVGNEAYYYDGERARKIEMTTEYGRVYFLDEDETDRIAIHKHMIEDADYETPLQAGRIHGVGIRDRVYWTWFQKQNVLALLMEYIERSALGFEIWTYPWGNDQALQAVQQAAANRLGAGKNIVFLPRQPGQEELFQMEHVETGLQGVQVVDEIVHRYYEWQIKRYVLGQILSTEPEGAGLGSSGLSDFQQSSLNTILKYDATNLDETLTNQLLPGIRKRNRHILPFATDDVPVRFVSDTEDDDVKERLEAIGKAYEMGLQIKQSDLYAVVGLEKPSLEDEVLPGMSSGLAIGGIPGGPNLNDTGAPGPNTSPTTGQAAPPQPTANPTDLPSGFPGLALTKPALAAAAIPVGASSN